MNNFSTTRRLRRTRMIAVLLILVIPAVYFSAYAAALEGKVYRGIGVDPVSGINRHAIEPSFHFCDTASNSFFKPALWVDQHIRNEYWNTIENKLTGKKWHNP